MTRATTLPGDLPDVASTSSLSGGSIADTYRATLTDGREVVVKRTQYDARLEAEGLEALGAAGAPVPEVLGASEDTLVLEQVHGPPDWSRLGAGLARVHRSTGAAFGWDRDNVIGPLPQANPRTDDWPTFYVEHRLAPWLGASALPADTRRRLERAMDDPLRELLAHDPVPSLVHGDLWSGNVVDGRYLIDPAVHHADREFDLAFAELFGGFPEAFWSAYHDEWPLDDGWQDRRPALQLYHLLIHVELFGAGYASGVTQRLDRYGW